MAAVRARHSPVRLLPNHLHVLLQLGSSADTLGAIVGSVKRFTTRSSWELGYEGQLWQGRFYDHVMHTRQDGRRAAQYILDNPVRRGLCGEPEAYAWSGMPDALE
jgi:REP element-mobilizing transposase RayT